MSATAPVLTPGEQLEVDRFGLHDEEILGNLAEHFDDELMCHIGDAVAVARIITVCCGTSFMICDPHLDAVRRRVADAAGMRCLTCDRTVTDPQFDQIYRVVPL